MFKTKGDLKLTITSHLPQRADLPTDHQHTKHLKEGSHTLGAMMTKKLSLGNLLWHFFGDRETFKNIPQASHNFLFPPLAIATMNKEFLPLVLSNPCFRTKELEFQRRSRAWPTSPVKWVAETLGSCQASQMPVSKTYDLSWFTLLCLGVLGLFWVVFETMSDVSLVVF